MSLEVPGDPILRRREERSENTLRLAVVPPVATVDEPPGKPQTREDGPRLVAVFPERPNVIGELSLQGYGFHVDRKPVVHFEKGSIHLESGANRGGGASDDPETVRWIGVDLPKGITPGTWQITVEVDGRRSLPVALTIAEPVVARLERIDPAVLNPDGLVELWGEHVGQPALIDVVDSHGRTWTFESGTLGPVTGFVVPMDFPPGRATARIRFPFRDDLVSNPLSFTVTTDPLPFEIHTGDMRQVAPGQGTDMWIDQRAGSLRWAERIEVEFTQGSNVFAETRSPASTRVQVPAGLVPGQAMLRGRTWRGGVASAWSDPQPYEVSARVQGVDLYSLSVGPLQQNVDFALGLTRPKIFRASPGDDLRIAGDFPIASPTSVHVVLESRTGRRRRLRARWEGDGAVRVTLPADLDTGPWELVLMGENMASTRVPIAMAVVKP